MVGAGALSACEPSSSDPQAPNRSPHKTQSVSKARPETDLQAGITSFTRDPTGWLNQPNRN